MIYRCVSTPEFQQRHFSSGVTGKALLQAPAAIYGEADYMHENYFRQHFKSYREGRPTLHYVPSPEGLVQFAVKGLAYALLPHPSIEKHLSESTLIDLLPQKSLKLPLYWQTQELQTEITTSLSRSIVSHARSVLE
jgi:LysR family transcriptional regulator (chromosome initiation inhibitor)